MRTGGRLALDVVLRVASDLEAALDDVRAASVVYPTLEAHDVFVTSCGEIKLLDFGIKSDDPSWARSDVRTVGALLYFLLSHPRDLEPRTATAHDRRAVDRSSRRRADLAVAPMKGAGWPDVAEMCAVLHEATNAALDPSSFPTDLQPSRSSTSGPARLLFTLSTIANSFQ